MEETEPPTEETRHGRCTITVSEDKSVASLTLVPPEGGDPVTAAQIHEALKAAGVVAGILPDEIEAAVAEGSADDRVVARGQEARDGEDATFVSLLPEPEERRPHEDEDGHIDYRDLGQIAAVHAGDPVMRRTPATEGENGYDVTGKVLKAKPGKNTPFSNLTKGAKPDPADPDLLCAAITGRPIVSPTGVSVEPVVAFPQVDTASGHVEFDGAVEVQGDVGSGMRIRATGDVLIGGSVGAARIEAGGKIVVKGGVIGGGEADGSEADHAVIRCGGSFQAGFVEYAHIESPSDIVIDDHCMYCTLSAGGRVVVGREGSRTGHIRGGTVSAATLVKAVTFGSSVGVKTVVRVGGNTALDAAAKVVVDRQIYSGTEIHIGSRCWTSHDDHANGVFRLKEDEIVFGAS